MNRLQTNNVVVLMKHRKDPWAMSTPASDNEIGVTEKTVRIPVDMHKFKTLETFFNWCKPVLGALFLASFFLAGVGTFGTLGPGLCALVSGAAYYWLINRYLPTEQFSAKLSVDLSASLKPLFEEVGVYEIHYSSPDPAQPSFMIKKIAGNYLVFITEEVKTKFDYEVARDGIASLVCDELASIKKNSKRKLSWG